MILDIVLLIFISIRLPIDMTSLVQTTCKTDDYIDEKGELEKQKKAYVRTMSLIIAGLFAYIVIRMIPIDVLISMVFLGAFTGLILQYKWKQLRAKGLINCLSPKAQELLTKKSIFDVYSDIVYYPLISTIIKSFVRPLVTKPPPEQLFSTFSQLPASIRQKIATKGILHLAPESIEKLILKENCTVLGEQYGKINPTWYGKQKYESEVHLRPVKPTLKQEVFKKMQAHRWHYLLILSIGLILVGRKHSGEQLRRFLGRKGLEVGGILFIVSLLFTLRKIKRATQQEEKPCPNRLVLTC